MSPSTPKTVLITGCSAGSIGSALAEDFHERGLHVFATARTPSKMSHLEKLPNVTLLELDVESAASVQAAVEVVTAQTGGKLDYLVNNAGLAHIRPVLDSDLEEAKRVFDVNFWGVARVTQAFAPLMITSKGMIINICSLAATMPLPWCAFYASSKAALKSYGETLRLEMTPLGVKVMTVMAGAIGTNIFANYSPPPLPENSLFKAASKEIHLVESRGVVENCTPVSLFAKGVVDDVLGGSSGLTWRGKLASITWAATSFLPAWIMDLLIISSSGLRRISRAP
ncbi:hypothetical protein EYZ11_001086 [Aspergillus tanneri]|uniref:Ketoreductase domain-containing protein n=1 Tax=Aspergillus tanneri TaxID=1220188 RepID=A0A4S3JVI2_9EURO|nr:uncharacterized protein ATNIH1004_009725 [Aspergillus tanneri]KAA8642963.1 hypothetical protein ATNIH1004_009725 [Aspergillus tanneri]THC99448.1 hypothetical protein EYZ11_001086 [Aspergillus tanneri]